VSAGMDPTGTKSPCSFGSRVLIAELHAAAGAMLEQRVAPSSPQGGWSHLWPQTLQRYRLSLCMEVIRGWWLGSTTSQTRRSVSEVALQRPPAAACPMIGLCVEAKRLAAMRATERIVEGIGPWALYLKALKRHGWGLQARQGERSFAEIRFDHAKHLLKLKRAPGLDCFRQIAAFWTHREFLSS
jgi:hypothetical protein